MLHDEGCKYRYWNCLCECYINVCKYMKLFMWMLHDALASIWNCLFECYMMFASIDIEIVYVNVTWWRLRMKLFMWMLHNVGKYMNLFMRMLHNVCKYRDWNCLCECYIMFASIEIKIVHVNVTWCSCKYMKLFMWMIHNVIMFASIWNCLCECYIMLLQVYAIVYVNVT
jgi:hypothetical protein